MVGLNILIGQTLKNIEQIGTDMIVFTTDDGKRYKLYHDQDCCESVEINDVVGDLNDLIGEPILIAEVVKSHENPKYLYDESFTWTFYKLATRKGHATIRWYGESNGYYSEEVHFERVTTA